MEPLAPLAFDPGPPVVSGSGPPFVVVHGLGASNRVVAEIFAPRLRDAFTVIGFDLPGHGMLGAVLYAAAFDAEQPIVEFAERLAVSLSALGVRRFAIGGISFGALVALEVAARYPDRVRALVLQGAPCWRHGSDRALLAAIPALRWLYRAVPRRVSRAVIEWIRRAAQRIHGPLPPQMDAMEKESRSFLNHDLWMDCIGGAARYDAHGALRRVRCPLLVVDGGETEAYFPGTSPERMARCARSEGVAFAFATIPGAGHTVAMTHPDGLAQAMRAFLETNAVS